MQNVDVIYKIMMSDADMSRDEVVHAVEIVLPSLKRSLLEPASGQEIEAERLLLLERADGVCLQAADHLKGSAPGTELISSMVRRLFTDYAEHLARTFSAV